MMVTAATERNIRLIVETVVMSHTSITHRVEHGAQGIPPHYGFSLLISVEYAYVEHYPGPSPGFCSRGAKNNKGGHLFKMQYWMCAATEDQTWNGGHRFYMGSRASLPPSLATTLTLPLNALYSLRCLEGITFQTEWLNSKNLCVSPKSQISLQPSNLKL